MPEFFNRLQDLISKIPDPTKQGMGMKGEDGTGSGRYQECIRSPLLNAPSMLDRAYAPLKVNIWSAQAPLLL
jgi:hypothetical protein